MRLLDFRRLDKALGLPEVYVICVGAMISSGFFLLPGLATIHAGRGVVLAYLIAGVIIVPAMLSQAELATAMPRAGGSYYFLDRTLGPLVGTIGGVGTWLTLVLKSAFALIGMGAYLGLVFDLPILVTATGAAVVFVVLNSLGARESSGFLRILVVILLASLTFFIVDGLAELFIPSDGDRRRASGPLFPLGSDGLFEAIGLVFVSFIGLTKVASLAEEVKNPDRNLPLGMGLGLLTVTVIYVSGVYVMVTVLGTERLSASLTPVADAAAAMGRWIPAAVLKWLMVGAGVVAFASMANAGILAASRYPLAMARDRLFPDRFASTNARGTPVAATIFTGAMLVGAVLLLPVEGLAKLASALQLLLFGLINVAVIVMRESRIEAYDPGYRAPLYPWLQLAGIFVALLLVAEMGWLSVLFTTGVTFGCVAWYNHYARHRIERDGAIFHVFERLGRRRFAGLDRELRGILKEKGLRAEDPFDQLVTRSAVLDYPEPVSVRDVVTAGSARLGRALRTPAEVIAEGLSHGFEAGEAAIAHGVALLHTRVADLDGSELVLVRCREGVFVDQVDRQLVGPTDRAPVRALFLLVSGARDPGRHLRILAHLASRVEDQSFVETWLAAPKAQDLKEALLRDERFRTLEIRQGASTGGLIGGTLSQLDLPPGCVVALLGRGDRSVVPRGHMLLAEGDRLTILGRSEDLRQLNRRYPGATVTAPLPGRPPAEPA